MVFRRKVLLVKSSVDTRYAIDEVVSHNGERMRCLAVTSMADIAPRIGPKEYEKVGPWCQLGDHAECTLWCSRVMMVPKANMTAPPV